ncbi:hypothetical protein ACNTMW_32845 [Planosporangium sp. 12N6]|uniref:hypothetical protein n=1 Tax=Planosporangium spinosum TaxID=3402278 RepID=UPI003CFAA625
MEDVSAALDAAASGPVAEGVVGAGTGMQLFEPPGEGQGHEQLLQLILAQRWLLTTLPRRLALAHPGRDDFETCLVAGPRCWNGADAPMFVKPLQGSGSRGRGVGSGGRSRGRYTV